jgi:hypothetical protein
MAIRRSRSKQKSNRIWILLFALAAVSLSIYFKPDFFNSFTRIFKSPKTDSQNVCALLPELKRLPVIGRGPVRAQQTKHSPNIPAAGTCTFEFDGGSIVLMVFTRESLAQHGQLEYGAAYFKSIELGFEYALKESPLRVAGLGDEAIQVGYDVANSNQSQLIVRRDNDVLHLITTGIDAARSQMIAHAILNELK